MLEESKSPPSEPERFQRNNRPLVIAIIILLILCVCCALIAALGLGWFWTYGDALVGISQLRFLLLT